MVFLPLKTDKLQATWEGPHILDKLDDVTYVVARSGKKPKTVHVNMLKPYYNRSDAVFWISSVEGSPEDPEEPVMYGDWDGEAGIEELHLPDHLPSQDKDKLLTALKAFGTVFSNKPGQQVVRPGEALSRTSFGKGLKPVLNIVQALQPKVDLLAQLAAHCTENEGEEKLEAEQQWEEGEELR
ncbi:hypothetical protein Y1Q_0017386 [Alligator mississippiensis]|uniref:Integrase p58-like C-terminal domain-containing protein n=1 Tax=Alligator mississippiensis TaxID=8496 RepID=A0A151P4Q3_ALLMI|nr:hypothetical protein Y1Q_0017386 [Alligator mississippiensis]